MSTKSPNYLNHYRAFCEALKRNPDLKFTAFCSETGIPWRRLYDWMNRRHISLKRLYNGSSDDVVVKTKKESVQSKAKPIFHPMVVEKPTCTPVADAVLEKVHISMANGTAVSIDNCPVSVLITLLGNRF